MRKELITYFVPKAPESEMFRNLRTNIQFMNTSKQLKTLLITSTMPGEGKSYVSSNLAVTFAQAGKRVILVDCDMRKGRQFSIFGILPRPGISNYLSGVVDQNFQGDLNDLENYIQDTEVENLKVITAGSVPPNPTELLVSEKMHETIEVLKQKCDIVILDAPPALIVADSVILARQVDSCVIVTAHNETRLDEAEKVKNAIKNVGGKIAGIVINKIPASNKKYGNKYYYYYGSEDMYRDNENYEKKGLFSKIGAKLVDFFTIDSGENKQHNSARKRIIKKKNENFTKSGFYGDNWYDATSEWNNSERKIDEINNAQENENTNYQKDEYGNNKMEDDIYRNIKYNIKQQ